MLCLYTLHIYTNRITAKDSTNGALQDALEQSQAAEAIAKTDAAAAMTAVTDCNACMTAMEQDHADQTAAAVEAAVTAALANSSHNADIKAERRYVNLLQVQALTHTLEVLQAGFGAQCLMLQHVVACR
jgi:hypothetical protein